MNNTTVSGESDNRFDHKTIEAKWQEIWEHSLLDQISVHEAKKPFYNLMMFPYPSAEGLHVGNMYAFTGSDVYGRYKRLQGFDVFEPIGLDGFGIHSENYALKVGRHPMDHAQITEKNFYIQLHKIGAMFDWSRTVETYHPDYYRYTQWIFVQMYQHGLAYRANAQVNWCPGCKTVLSDEQVLPSSAKASEGTCERCGNVAEKKQLEQWFFKITAYAEKLLENLFSHEIDGKIVQGLDWTEKVKIAQKNWIGKKTGINITYEVVDEKGSQVGGVVCFTTRPDTNFGATFVVIAPEHPFVASLLNLKSQNSKVKGESNEIGTESREVLSHEQTVRIGQYVDYAKKKTSQERLAEGKKKTGVFTGLYCLNSLNNYKMPLYISDFVLVSVGTGAVVGVPGHDKRDFAFAKEMGIPIVRVVVGQDGKTGDITDEKDVQEEEGTMIHSDFLNGMDIHEATGKMMEYLEKKGWGKRVNTYHLRDWLISRQRYWGPPIPMIFCEDCKSKEKGERAEMPGWWSVPVDQLPVVLPRIDDYKPMGDGVPPLAHHKEFYETVCPGCGGKAVRETEVSDTFLDSSWYFLRYPSVVIPVIPRSGSDEGSLANASSNKLRDSSTPLRSAQNDTKVELPWNGDITRRWLPVHMYTGGAEHSVLHLMYSRFVTMALHDWGFLDFSGEAGSSSAGEEPFSHFYAHGLVIKDGAKMSKSKGNVINPDEYIALYGADALRLYLMFMGPFDQGGDFRDSAMEGMSRWMGRVWRLVRSSWFMVHGKTGQKDGDNKQSQPLSDKVHTALQKLIKKVGDDIERRHYNTAIASMMEFTNLVGDVGGLTENDAKTFLILLAPFAPYITEELWHMINKYNSASFDVNQSIHNQSWPTYEKESLVEETLEIIVQVNGKLRDRFKVQSAKCKVQEDIEKAAKSRENVQKFLKGKSVIKVIFVPGKLINFVVSQ